MTPAPHDILLAVNTGSSSIKFQLFADIPDLTLLARGEVENMGSAPTFSATDAQTKYTDKQALPANCTYESALQFILDWVVKDGSSNLSAVAHRIVHGGAFKESVKVSSTVIKELKKLIPFAPYHQPHSLAAIELVEKIKPGTIQIACFDTAFHSSHGELFTQYALPEKMRKEGIRRYGFHGLSYEWIAHTLRQSDPALAAGRIIAAHLGSGASICGMHDGVSIDSSMGLTALEGLLMGTRCGNIDPGAIIYMIRDLGLSVDEAESILYKESGLRGLSGMTDDVRLLQESDKPEAQFSLDYFALRAAQYMGEMAVAIGGVDGIVFTGGIGEHSDVIRYKILGRLAFLKPFELRVIPANEERMMAMHTQSCLKHIKGINL